MIVAYNGAGPEPPPGRRIRMLFSRRRWAIRVVERMGISMLTKEATVLIQTLIWASKLNAPEATGFGSKKRDQILGWAIIMFNNPTAAQQVARELRTTQKEAVELLLRMKQAGRELALKAKATTLTYIADASDGWTSGLSR